MSARSKARKRALDVLYAADLRGASAFEVLADLIAERASAGDEMNAYTIDLVEGVAANSAALDSAIVTYAQDWDLDRMPAVDRTILRIAAFEILFRRDIPEGVAISEAVELAGEYSTEASAAFVNGLLAKIAASRPPLLGDGTR